MTGWRMRPTASVLGVIAIIPVMITVTALEAESGAIERGNNHLDAEERRFDETIETKNRTVETGWPRDNVTALEEIVPALAATNQDDVAQLDKLQFRDRVGSRTLASDQAKSIEVTPDEGTVAECTTTKDSSSFVTVAETRSDNASRRYLDNQMIFASRRIEDSEQAEEAQSFPERDDVRGTNETTIERSRDDWLTTSTEEEEEDEEEREEEQEEQQEEEEEEEDDEDEENENVMRARYGEQRNVEDIRAISFHVPPPPPPPPKDTDGKYQDGQVQSGTSGEARKLGETRKNQSNRAANNLLLTGKSTKAFYEIKPSSKTLEMERGYEQQNHATTHRTPPGRKFILPSVDSAYGKFGPYFEDGDHELNITARIGSTVLLDCKIGMLGDKKVTWLQHNKDSFRLLTVGRTPYNLDQRISLNFRYPSNWRLQILYASPHDSGLYQCQVATHPPLDKKINVVVTAPVLTISDDSGRIVSKERHLKAGSVLRLRCEARDVLESLNESVVWTRGDETLTEDVSENRTTEISAGKEVLVIVSTLIVERASPRHAGNYSCMVPGKAKTTVAVHVLNGELPAAVHDGNGVSRAFLNLWLVHLTMSYVFTR